MILHLQHRFSQQRGRRRGFTLVEIMIAVLIIGILLAIALPNFVKYMENSRGRSCQRTLKEIMGAKERWAMHGGHGPQDTPTMGDIAGQDKFLRQEPKCPSGGTYAVGRLDETPTCSIGGPAGQAESHTLDG